MDSEIAVHYFLRKRRFNEAIHEISTSKQAGYALQETLQFWRAAALVFGGRPSSVAVKELSTFLDKKEFQIAAPILLIVAHERCDFPDQEAIEELRARLTINASMASSEQMWCLAALAQMYLGAFDEARDCVRSALLLNASSQSIRAVQGWIELVSYQVAGSSVSRSAASLQSASLAFEGILEKSPRDLDALMGRLLIARIKNSQAHKTALETASQILIYYQGFRPALIELAYLQAESGAWDLSMETCVRLRHPISHSDNSTNCNWYDAQLLQSIYELLVKGNLEAGLIQFKLLLDKVIGPESAQQALEASLLVSRICQKDPAILNFCMKLMDMTSDMKTTQSFSQRAWLSIQLNELERGQKFYQMALEIDPHDQEALLGSVHIDLLQGNVQKAAEELFTIKQLSPNLPPKAAYLNSLLAHQISKEKEFDHLQEALNDQISSFDEGCTMLQAFATWDPCLTLDMVDAFLRTEDVRSHDVDALKLVSSLLERLLRVYKGSSEGLILLARIKLELNLVREAESLLKASIGMHPANSNAQCLLSDVYLRSGQSNMALETLETALSFDFTLRNLPSFKALKARALKEQGHYDECVSLLESILSLPEFKALLLNKGLTSSVLRKLITRSECVKIYLDLVDSYSKLKQLDASKRVMNEALAAFSGTPEEGSLIIGNAYLYVELGNVDAAINHLVSIRPEQLHFTSSRKAMAKIYLDYKNDRKNYAKCFGEIVEYTASLESRLLLGDAYMNIQEPEQAVTVYKSALEAYPEELSLRGKIGEALTKTHDFKRAIAYYEQAISISEVGCFELSYNLASLYYRLKNLDSAERIVMRSLNAKSDEDTVYFRHQVKLYTLLSKIQKLRGMADLAFASLSAARKMQLHLLSKQSENFEGRTLLANLCFELGELCRLHLNDLEQAHAFYNESVQYLPTHKKALVSLAKTFVARNDYASAQKQCGKIIELETEIDDAILLMADVGNQSSSYEDSVSQLAMILKDNPTHYKALERLIELQRRHGKLNDALVFFEHAENRGANRQLEAGYQYCKGIYYRSINNHNAALKALLQSRKDKEWGEKSLKNMIEIFLNPQNDTLGGEALGKAASIVSLEKSDDQSDEPSSLLTAEKLVKELANREHTPSLRTMVLEAHVIMGTKRNPDIERSLQLLTKILEEHPDYIPALYGIAVAYVYLKQPPRARNYLKRIVKAEWKSDLADDFEKSWLLLADLYIQGGKYDLAIELLKKCVSSNKSCSKAWEYLGFVMEKEASYDDAANHYHKAFVLERESNPSLGFKLAFNYLKAKKYVETVDVCHTILNLAQDYPKLQKEILSKALTNLRCP